MGRRPGPTLFDRDAELEALDAALGDALGGSGSFVLIEGPAGIGKTALLTAAGEHAAQRGMLVLSAIASELERDFPHGVVRQLLERPIRDAGDEQRRRLLDGAASPGAPAVLDSDAPAATAIDQPFAVVHGLYWLVANMAAEAPLALLLDDVHWADPPSLRFFAYLIPRLGGLAATVIGSARAGEEGSDRQLMQSLRSAPAARRLRPGALTEEGAGRLLSAEFDQRAGREFVIACQAATGGNPFYLRELAGALRTDGIAPTGREVGRISDTAPATIAQLTLMRLGRLGEHAIELARAIAVLDADATVPRAAALGGLDEHEALTAIDALLATETLSMEQRPAFRHPIVRAAIYDDIGPGVRSASHRRAAELLRAEGASLDEVAAHLLACEPIGSADTVATLRDAAAHALAVGAPESAAAYLGRALDEGPERETRAGLLVELGLTAQMAGQPAAMAHFEQAGRLTADPITRARAALHGAECAWYMGDWSAMLSLIDQASASADGDRALGVEIEVLRAGVTMNDPRLVHDVEQRRAIWEQMLTGEEPRSRQMALVLAAWAAAHDEPRERVTGLVEFGWDGGRYLADDESIVVLPQGVVALQLIDQLDAADAMVAELLPSARQRGSALEYLVATAHQILGNALRGDLTRAASETRNGLELALELNLHNVVLSIIYFGYEVFIERPDVADLAALVETIELGPLTEIQQGALVMATRARLRFAAGDVALAIEDMRRAGAINDALGYTNYVGLATWRSKLALMLGADSREEALALTQAELDDARRSGMARRIGIALRALGQLHPDRDTATAHLHEAVTVLADSSARLEHARAQIELGAALRRAGDRRAARDLLREGLDTAIACGAIRTGDRARDELAATGARPRRERITGRDALTASELRVARLAAEGRTSREIAQALFVTTRTIDAHLAHTYTKLGINSRKQLPEALADHSS